jgi:hypothetical protein
MLLIAELCIACGAGLIVFVAGQALQIFTNTQERHMASAVNLELASVVSSLVRLAMSQADQIAKPHPDSQALADEIAAEQAMVDQIKAAMPAAVVSAPAAPIPATEPAPAPTNALDAALAAAAAKANP